MILYFLSIQNAELKYLDYVIYIRLLDVLKKQTKIQENYSRNSAVSVSGKVVKLILILCFIAHLSACWFIQIGKLQMQQNKKSWLTVAQLPSENWIDVYITGVYWAAITMVTLGYGDIVPVTTIERCYVIIMSLISCGVFAYSFNQIGEILQEMERNTLKLKSRMKKVNYLMHKRGIDHLLQTRVRKYYEYYFQEELNSESNCRILLENLTSKLKEEVLKDLYAKKLKNHKIFYLNFSSQVLEALSLRIKEVNLVAEEYIFRKNQYDDKIYILISGELELVCNESNAKGVTLLRRYATEEVIGEEEFFHNSRKRQYSLKATNISCVAYLTQEDFYSVLQDFPEEYLRDKISLYDQYQTLGLKCIVCDNFHHKYDSCPYLRIEDRKQVVLEQENKSQEQLRVKVERNIKKYNSRLNQDIVKKTVMNLEYNNQSHVNFCSDSDDDNDESYGSESNIQVNLGQPSNAIRSRAPSSNISNLSNHIDANQGQSSNLNNINNQRRRSQYVEQIVKTTSQEDNNLSTQQSMNNQELLGSINYGEKKKTQKRASAFVNPSDLINLHQSQNLLKRFNTIGNKKNDNNNDNSSLNSSIMNNNCNNNTSMNNFNSYQNQSSQHQFKSLNRQIQFDLNISGNLNKMSNVQNLYNQVKIQEEMMQNIQHMQNQLSGKLALNQKKDGRRRSTIKIVPPIVNNEGNLNPALQKLNRSMSKKFKPDGQRNSIYERIELLNQNYVEDDDYNSYRFCMFDIEEKFDSLKEFVRYFPSNNMSTVLRNFFLNQIHSKVRGRKNKKKKFSQQNQIVKRKNTLRQSTKIIPSTKKNIK